MVVREVFRWVITELGWLTVSQEVHSWWGHSISEVPNRGTSSYDVELQALGLSVFQRIGL